MENPPMPVSSLEHLKQVADQAQSLTVTKLHSRRDTEDRPEPFTGSVLARLEGPEAERLLHHVRTLRPGKQARCHNPAFALTLSGPHLLDCHVAFCFDCNNASTRIGEADGFFTFDAMAQSAAELLRIMRAYDPEQQEEQDWWE